MSERRQSVLWLLFFTVASLCDGLLTEHVLRFPFVVEANPLLVWSWQNLPGGMFAVKILVSLVLLVCVAKIRAPVAASLAFAMLAVCVWNAAILSAI